MITVTNLSKTFKLSRQQQREMEGAGSPTVNAVNDISFTCQSGRVFALLGPNGAGKTTTLRMIATMLKPSEGHISVSGYDTVNQAQEVRKRLGFLTGNTGLYDRLTANEMVKYFADLNGMGEEQYEQRREHFFSLLDVHDFANRRLGKLSSGIRQKVSIVRTVIHNSDVIVFDEPTSGLDVVTSRNIVQLIRDCKSEGKTIVFSTHRMGEVSQLSDDLAIIHQGTLLYNGSYGDFQSQMQTPSLEDEFIRILEASE